MNKNADIKKERAVMRNDVLEDLALTGSFQGKRIKRRMRRVYSFDVLELLDGGKNTTKA